MKPERVQLRQPPLSVPEAWGCWWRSQGPACGLWWQNWRPGGFCHRPHTHTDPPSPLPWQRWEACLSRTLPWLCSCSSAAKLNFASTSWTSGADQHSRECCRLTVAGGGLRLPSLITSSAPPSSDSTSPDREQSGRCHAAAGETSQALQKCAGEDQTIFHEIMPEN